MQKCVYRLKCNFLGEWCGPRAFVMLKLLIAIEWFVSIERRSFLFKVPLSKVKIKLLVIGFLDILWKKSMVQCQVFSSKFTFLTCTCFWLFLAFDFINYRITILLPCIYVTSFYIFATGVHLCFQTFLFSIEIHRTQSYKSI